MTSLRTFGMWECYLICHSERGSNLWRFSLKTTVALQLKNHCGAASLHLLSQRNNIASLHYYSV
jgi:hypothetical protein